MTPNPLLGVFFHWLGGLFSWILAPWLFAGLRTHDQFFFYTMGESQMGRYAFSSWTLHMSSIIILIGAAVVIGFGNKMVQG